MNNSFLIKYIAENDEERIVTGNIFFQSMMRYWSFFLFFQMQTRTLQSIMFFREVIRELRR